MTLKKEIVDLLKDKKNLLGFSYQTDSTALFYTLLKNDVPFDIAMVDYGVREESKEEIKAGKKLCKKHNKKFFSKEAEKIEKNFEANARKIRYDFFEEIIKEKNYDNLLTAHQLNDKLEWFFMQFGKGAGICELKGLDLISEKKSYKIIRPFLTFSKEEIENFLKENNFHYFVDHTNQDEKYKRNFIRSNFANDFIKQYKDGVLKSFEYIQKDCDYILKEYNYKKIKDLYILKEREELISIKEIELTIKKMGYILSKPQKDEILKTKDCVIGGEIAISFHNQKIFINPFIENLTMDKKFKERCRVLKIPSKLRKYIYKEKINPQELIEVPL
ncbi:MAG: tRNA lysidine(34) synthetase TilS [Campylobacterales bacterium]|nr:tRNA lysidine(34) synthetase TilS [Campylobacterales bacterium]